MRVVAIGIDTEKIDKLYEEWNVSSGRTYPCYTKENNCLNYIYNDFAKGVPFFPCVKEGKVIVKKDENGKPEKDEKGKEVVDEKRGKLETMEEYIIRVFGLQKAK